MPYGPLLWTVLWAGATSTLTPIWRDDMAGQLNWLKKKKNNEKKTFIKVQTHFFVYKDNIK